MTTQAKDTLTETQRSLLIWFYNNKDSCTIDWGNILYAHGEITGDTFDEREECDSNLQALIDKKFVNQEAPPTDCFYYISAEGIKHIEDTTETTLMFQCEKCGDMWSPDIDDPMLLEAYLAEHPDGHVSIDKCEACEVQEERWHNLTDAADLLNDPLHRLYKALADAEDEKA